MIFIYILVFFATIIALVYFLRKKFNFSDYSNLKEEDDYLNVRIRKEDEDEK